jgi:hypothetical protein
MAHSLQEVSEMNTLEIAFREKELKEWQTMCAIVPVWDRVMNKAKEEPGVTYTSAAFKMTCGTNASFLCPKQKSAKKKGKK